MSDLRAIAEPYVADPIISAALYRPASPHDEPLKVVSGAPVFALPEVVIRMLIRKSRENRLRDKPIKVVSQTAHVLLALGGQEITLLVVRSRLRGWTNKRVIATLRRDTIAARAVQGEPFGLELTWPGNGFIRLRPMYMTADAEEIARALLGDTQ